MLALNHGMAIPDVWRLPSDPKSLNISRSRAAEEGAGWATQSWCAARQQMSIAGKGQPRRGQAWKACGFASEQLLSCKL